MICAYVCNLERYLYYDYLPRKNIYSCMFPLIKYQTNLKMCVYMCFMQNVTRNIIFWRVCAYLGVCVCVFVVIVNHLSSSKILLINKNKYAKPGQFSSRLFNKQTPAMCHKSLLRFFLHST